MDLHIEIPTAPIPTGATRRPLLIRDGDTDDYILRIDNSTLEKLQTCPRSVEYYTVDRRERVGSAALIFGGAVHECLEHYYKHPDATLPDILTPGLTKLATTPVLPNEWRTPEMLNVVMDSYLREYKLGDLRPLTFPTSSGPTPAVEIGFSLQLFDLLLDKCMSYTREQLLGDGETVIADGEKPLYVRRLYILWSGKIDLITKHVDQTMICDHKTSSMGGPTFYEQFRLSQPVHGYMWAAQRIMKEPITTFLLNAIFIRKPTKTGKSVEFERRMYQYTDHHMNEWEKDVTAEITSFVHNLTVGYFPKAPVWCMGKYGACQYHDVCTVDDASARHQLLHSGYYTDVTWSPIAE